MIHLIKLWHGDVYGTEHPPLGILSVAKSLRQRDHAVRVIHETKGWQPNPSEFRSGDIVGFSIITGDPMSDILRCCQQIKKHTPNVTIVFGGVHPTLCPEQCLQEEDVDHVIMHDGEDRLPALVERLNQGRSAEGLDGVGYKANRRIIVQPPTRMQKDLDVYEPDWGVVDIERYVRPYRGMNRVLMGYTVTRGCPHNCGFCYNQSFGKRTWRHTSAPVAADRVNTLAEQHKLDGVLFYDDNLTANRKWFVQMLHDLRIPAVHVETRIDYLTPEFLSEMKSNDVVSLFLGVESGSDRILNLLNKGFTVEDIRCALKRTEAHGLPVKLSFILGVPTETLDEYRQTLHLIVWCMETLSNLSGFTLGFYLPYPGTPLYELCLRKGFKEPGKLQDWEQLDRWGTTRMEIPWAPHLNTDEVLNVRRLVSRMMRRDRFYPIYRRRLLASGSRWVRWLRPVERFLTTRKRKEH